jgi:hypothetical protein
MQVTMPQRRHKFYHVNGTLIYRRLKIEFPNIPILKYLFQVLAIRHTNSRYIYTTTSDLIQDTGYTGCIKEWYRSR